MRPGPRLGLGAALVAALLVGAAGPLPETPADAAAECVALPALSALGAGLDRTAALIAQGRGLTILAMGSSSTQGVGASAPAMNYPSRLERALRDEFPTTAITVVNHGRGGQDVDEEFARLSRDIAAEHPDLVVWQVGTNALLRHEDLATEEQLISRGVELIKERGIDVVLMDLQYAPRVLARRSWGEMEQLIAETARREQVGLVRRFEIMRQWQRAGDLPPAALIGADGLHMTDASYGCLAREVARSLAAQWRGQNKLAASPHRSPAALAGRDRPPTATAR